MQATDWEGRWIGWPARGYERHAAYRPEIRDWHEAIQATVGDPEVVAEVPGGGWDYYRRGVLPDRYGDCYLLVAVK